MRLILVIALSLMALPSWAHQLKSVRVGFAGDQLAALDILDSFGQRSLIRFTGMQANPALPAGTFQFKPPAGADVVRP